MERLALGIARNVVPPPPAGTPGEGAEAAARLSISAAVAEQAEAHDSTDPLGYGRIDPRTLTLVRAAITGRAINGGWVGAGVSVIALGEWWMPGHKCCKAEQLPYPTNA